jgi:DNA adenine methylase
MTNKSPLRYPGGKSRAVRRILPYFPRNEIGVVSIFLGGGSVELALCELGKFVRAYDNSYDLVTFWEMVLRDPDGLARRVESLLFPKLQQLHSRFFRRLQSGIGLIDDPRDRAACYFLLNRASFSGSTQAGGMSTHIDRLTPSSIEKMRNFRCDNMTVSCQDFRLSIPANANRYLFLDPPYALPKGRNNLYGVRGRAHRNFDHLALHRLLRARKGGRFLLCYNDCEFIRELYHDYDQVPLDWAYGMNKSKESSELLIIA